TDEEHLRSTDAHRKVLIGKDVSFGRDAGGFPEIGEHCAEKARDVIKQALRGYDIVFVVAGMGGGTGTGVAPIVASIARDMNAVTFALPILPFDHEGAARRQTAADGISKLKENANFTIVLDNNKLTEYVADMPVADALKVVDRSVLRIVESVCNQASSYVSNMMQDILGYSDMIEESAPVPPTDIRDTQLIHADLDPMFSDFGPSMFG
ncbi:MAG: hypothetical protein KJ672_06200, partial [Candidatus Thermoplasmatota archaeon]|nr:hypothetical protein [Candidatus Thermoplasmatota archaeon]